MSRPTRYPQMRLDLGALEHNISAMAAWCHSRGVRLAPHIKTTMSEPVVERQVAAGAVALTVATVEQAEIAHGWGHRRILIGNEVVDGGSLGRLRALIARGCAVSILVDSVDGVRAAAAFTDAAHPLSVLLDIGTPGGRTGVRDRSRARDVANAVRAEAALRLVGVSGYEGVVANDRHDATLAAVDAHCRRTADAFVAHADRYECDRPILTMGGSVFPDRVVEALPRPSAVPDAEYWLRSGCYAIHDHGTYAEAGPPLGLTAAAAVRAVVLSTPEPGMAVLGAGKRELPHDAGVPTLLSHVGVVSHLYDHHAVLTGLVPATGGLRVGDLVELGVSHPCSLFARWERYDVVRDGAVVDVWRTEFHHRETNAFQ